MPKYGGDVLDFADLNFDYKIEPVRSPAPFSGFALEFSLPNRDLVFETRDDRIESYLDIFVRVRKRDGTGGGNFEERLLIGFNKSDEEAVMKTVTIYRKLFELPAGTYKIDIAVRDRRSGNRGIRSTNFEVPK
ncbi:MAG: hypothetical protein JSS81_16915 [Acidobacteria bacterium]|nr:hypothetical protein [Acidobacteriota bacterium]